MDRSAQGRAVVHGEVYVTRPVSVGLNNGLRRQVSLEGAGIGEAKYGAAAVRGRRVQVRAETHVDEALTADGAAVVVECAAVHVHGAARVDRQLEGILVEGGSRRHDGHRVRGDRVKIVVGKVAVNRGRAAEGSLIVDPV